MRPCERDVAGRRSVESSAYERGGYESEYEGDGMGMKEIFLYEMKRVAVRLDGEAAMAALMTGV